MADQWKTSSLVATLRKNYGLRNAVAVTFAVLVAGSGVAAYNYGNINGRRTRRRRTRDEDQAEEGGSGSRERGGNETSDKQLAVGTGKGDGKGRSRKGRVGMKSVAALVSLLMAEMGERGMISLWALATMAVVRTSLGNRLARVQGLLFRATFLRRVPLFARLITENLVLCLAQSVILSTIKFLSGSLGLQWRRILTNRIHSDYFQNMAYYKMSHVDGRITVPEQRISGDVPRFCVELGDLIQENVVSLIDALFYTYRLCSYTHPKYALGILAYVIGAGAVTGVLSPPFGKLIAEEQQREGDYRQMHNRLRTHSESIAFYGGQSREGLLLGQQFNRLTKHVSTVLHTQWWFGMIQDFFLKYFGATWAVVLIIGPFFGGDMRPTHSVEGRAAMLSNMRYHTSVVIALFQAMGTLASSTRRLSRLGGYAERIRELLAVSRELRTSSNLELTAGTFEEAQHIEFEGVTIVTPAGTTLVENLTLRVDRGHNLLITGPNGSGKSSLFRVLGGLWPLVSGRIAKPGQEADLSGEIFYVPQRPYSVVGTLQDQLVYPLTSANLPQALTDEQMRTMLKMVDLENLMDRYAPEEEVNWGEELSLGEQQRLGMARLFYHAPSFAILDECTSAVTTDMEERFCSRVRSMGTTCVTISHRPALVAFHDTVLSLDGEGGWKVHYRDGHQGLLERKGSHQSVSAIMDAPVETERKLDAATNMKQFLNISKESTEEISGEILGRAPSSSALLPAPSVPFLEPQGRSLPKRMAVLTAILVPQIVGKQGGQLGALAALVVGRTLLSDRIASLNGDTVDHVLQQDLKGFIRLIAVSVLQSSASSVIAPTLRHLTASLALGWRKRLTSQLLSLYLQNNAFYKATQLSGGIDDADARISQDVDKLCRDLSSLVTNLIKPLVDILWFTWRMQGLTGQRGVAMLYAYMLLGLGFLRAMTPDFGTLTGEEQRREGAFRFMHSRLRSHAESIAFFGGGKREQQVIESRFKDVIDQAELLLRKRWFFGIADEFISKQLPHNVTWGVSLLYALDYRRHGSLKEEGRLAHDLRFLASVVSQSFLAFGDVLEMYRNFLELSGGITRVSELNELLLACQTSAGSSTTVPFESGNDIFLNEREESVEKNEIAFTGADIVTPSNKLLARKLSMRVSEGQSLLVTGPNGSGKSSLFRVLGGLWPLASGHISKPKVMSSKNDVVGLTNDIFYVPQRPYMAQGSLREQIIYPLTCGEAAEKIDREKHSNSGLSPLAKLDEVLETILEDVRLMYLLRREGGWEAEGNWEDILSLGEQQRLGMARLFFHSPKFGILDECTNATSVDVEEGLYRKAQRLGITVVTISQRPALIPFHATELRLIDGEGDWELRSIQKQ